MVFPWLNIRGCAYSKLIVHILPLQKRPLENDSLEDDKENGAPVKRSRILFTIEQEEKLRKSFSEDKKISLKAAREFLKEHPEMFEGRTEKMIQDKWTNMQKKYTRL